MLSLILADYDPTAILKDAGFVQWVIYAIAAFMLWERIEKYAGRKKAKDVRVVEGSISVEEKQAFAERNDVEAEFLKLNDAIKSLKKETDKSLKELGDSNTSAHAAARTAGEHRVQNITEFVETETDALKVMIHDLTAEVKNLTSALHEKINGVALLVAEHKADIKNLQASDFRSWSQSQPRQRK